jgi:hypothetical protein
MKITDFELRGGTGILQPGPQKDLNQCNQVPRSWGREPRLAGQISATVVAGDEGETARKDQGARGNLAGGAMQVRVDRRGWNGDDPRRRR